MQGLNGNNMKNHLLILFRIFILVVVSSLSVSCKAKNAVSLPDAFTPTPVSEVSALPPTSAIESGLTANPTLEKNYEVISSTAIRKDDIFFEISGIASPGYLQLFVNAVTIKLPDSYTKGNLVENIIFEPATTPSLDLEPSGGGGGMGFENNNYVVNQEFDYRIRTPLSKGQIIHIVVSVTFNEFTGIVNPVVFEFDVPVE